MILEFLHRNTIGKDWIDGFVGGFTSENGKIVGFALLVELIWRCVEHRSFIAGSRASALGKAASAVRDLVRRRGSDERRTTLYDVFHFALVHFDVMTMFRFIFSLSGPVAVSVLVRKYCSLGLIARVDSVVLQIMLTVMARDFFFYCAHRIYHAVPAFWELHRFHHSVSDFNFFATHRTHPFELAFTQLATLIPLAVLGAPTQVFVVYSVFEGLITVFQHSNLPVQYGPLDKIFISPLAHRMHHSANPEDYDRNFGNLLSIWDVLFGTYKKGRVDVAIGLPEGDPFSGKIPFVGWWHCYVRFWKQLWRARPGRGEIPH